MTLNVIYRLQAFSNAIRRTFVQHFTRFQLTACSRGSSASAELLVNIRTITKNQISHCNKFFMLPKLPIRHKNNSSNSTYNKSTYVITD